MTDRNLTIDPDIRRASTLPGWVYSSSEVFEAQRERVFARSWQWLADGERLRAPGHALPATHLEGTLDEPLVLVRAEDGSLRCMSNVCTHRGALVVEGEGHLKSLKCRYHGRRYDLDGRCTFMPEFDDVAGFPADSDHLPQVPVAEWGSLSFASLDPAMPFDEWIAPVRERTTGMPIERAVYDPSSSGEYLIEANWALYCDNYLEEFHIPYVHGGSLSGALDYDAYRTELFAWGNLQVGVAKAGQPLLELAPGSPDYGQDIAGYYFWLFPATMLNFYPWGVSLNVVRPLGPSRTRVSFRSYLWDADARSVGPGANLHRIEMEDEEVVESVQKGVRSRLYHRGRYSPRREVGTHHFHTLLTRFLDL